MRQQEHGKMIPDLPLLCVSNIVEKLSLNDYGDREHAHKMCKTAASLARVGNTVATTMARMLWEIMDKGCTKSARDQHEKALVEWRCFKENYERIVEKLEPVPEVKVSIESKADEIKKACVELGCKRSGTKAQMLAEIQKAVESLRARRLAKLESLRKRRDGPPPKMPACYVTAKMRAMIAEKRAKTITASTAKSEHMLSEKDLEKLECKRVANPHYRSGPPMRLYKLVDVLDAVDRKYGCERALETAREARESRAAKARETKSNNERQRKAALDAQLQAAGVNLQRLFQMSAVAVSEYASAKSADHMIQMWRRLRELEDALAAKECALRPDSRLCADYINHAAGDPESIAETMYEMKFLFANTRYKALRDEIADRMANRMIEYDGYVDWEEINFEASREAKARAMAEWGARTPNAKDVPGVPKRFLRFL